LADATDSSLLRSAKQIRLNSNDLYRMKRRLLRGRAEGLGPRELLGILPALLRQECAEAAGSGRPALETWVRPAILPGTGAAGCVSWFQSQATQTGTQMAVPPLRVWVTATVRSRRLKRGVKRLAREPEQIGPVQ